MKKFLLTALFLSAIPLMAGCDDTPKTAEQAPQTQEEAREVIEDRLDKWLGKWEGPESTYLELEKSGEGYAVTIKSLDKEDRYLGVSQDMRIRFHRGDKEEYIRFGPGRDTGMKWLKDKPYCLIINKGEGYCRDKM